MDRNSHQKEVERKPEAEKPAENGGGLHRQVQELRDANAPLAQTKNTAQTHLPALEISGAKEMTLPLKAGEGPYGALQRQHPEWEHKRLLEEAHNVKKQTGQSTFRQSEQFYYKEDGSITSRVQTNGGYLETTSKDGKALETRNVSRDAGGPLSEKKPEAVEKKPEAAPGKPDVERKEWTIAVELAATLPGGKDNPNGYGADNKLKYLKQLAAETAGKPVSFVVHAERTVDSKGNLCHREDKPLSDEKAAACDIKAEEKGRQRTERYFIHDGKIEQLPDSTARNEKDSVKGLLKDAQELSPSNKIGLIIQSHGAGSDGIKTNRGELSLDKLSGSIKEGLAGSGHDKLDILDFDACNMGSVSVLNKLSSVSKNVVASAASEAAKDTGERGDGQNISAALRSLLSNPSQSGREFASGIVEQARAGENGEGKQNNTVTLASFDMEKYQDFKQSLDKFGQQLTHALSDKNSRDQIKQIIEQSVRPETEAPETESHERDLRSFAQNTLAAIESGKLKPSDRGLEEASREFLKSLDTLESNHFGEKTRGYEELAGLTANIPGKEALDRREVGRLLSPLHETAGELKKLLDEDLKFTDKKDVLEQLKGMTKDLYQALEGDPGNPVGKLRQAEKSISAASDLPELVSSIEKMRGLLQHLEGTQIGKFLASDGEQEYSSIRAKYHKSQTRGIAQGWDAFLAKLESTPY